MTSTPITAAATTRAESVISVNLRGIRRSRSCGVVSMRRSAPRRRAPAPGSDRSRPTTERRVRAIDRRSCEPSSLDDGLRVGDERLTEPGGRVMESRSGRPGRDLEEFGDLHEGQPEVVVQDEDRSLFDREPAERPLQFVAIGDGVVPSGVDGPSTGRTRTFAVHGGPAATRRSRRGRGSGGSRPRSDRGPEASGAGARRGRGRSAGRPRRGPGRAGSGRRPRRASR